VNKPGSFRRLEDLEQQWDADPDLREAYRQEVPYAEVAMAIIRLRVRHGLSQSEFAAKVGRPQSYIARLESGRANVEVGTLKAFAEALGERLNLSYEEQAVAASG
jgi:predicted transcriptional regulator